MSVTRVGLAVVLFLGVAAHAEAQTAARLVGRSVVKTAVRRATPAMVRSFAKDLANHKSGLVRAAMKARTVFRYTTRSRAAQELRRGLPSFRHMTSKAGGGRPLGGRSASARFGLPIKAEVRETIRIPRGHPLIANKVQAGARGVGELVSPKRLPKNAIVRVIPLR